MVLSRFEELKVALSMNRTYQSIHNTSILKIVCAKNKCYAARVTVNRIAGLWHSQRQKYLDIELKRFDRQLRHPDYPVRLTAYRVKTAFKDSHFFL